MPITENPVPLGKIAVPTPGTPVSVVSNFPSDPEISTMRANKIEIAALPANTGPIYVGYASMNKATLAKTIAVLPPGKSLVLTEQNALNVFEVSRFFVDADTAGDAALPYAHVR